MEETALYRSADNRCSLALVRQTQAYGISVIQTVIYVNHLDWQFCQFSVDTNKKPLEEAA
jgi:hypothetical protein